MTKIQIDRSLQKKWNVVWSKIKKDTDSVLKLNDQSIDYFKNRFKEIELTINPNKIAEYSPIRNILVYNFCYIFFFPPFAIASNLIHEEDHKLYHEETHKVKITNEEQKDFYSKFGKIS